MSLPSILIPARAWLQGGNGSQLSVTLCHFETPMMEKCIEPLMSFSPECLLLFLVSSYVWNDKLCPRTEKLA